VRGMYSSAGCCGAGRLPAQGCERSTSEALEQWFCELYYMRTTRSMPCCDSLSSRAGHLDDGCEQV
jgi:hypothetical protein